MKRAVLIHPGGQVQPVAIPGEFVSELSLCQEYVGGYITPWPNTPNFTVFVDEDGLVKGLAPNHLATSIFGTNQGTPIVGNALVLGPVDEEGDTLGLSVEQAAIFISPEGEDIINALAQLNQEKNDEQGMDFVEDAFGGELP